MSSRFLWRSGLLIRWLALGALTSLVGVRSPSVAAQRATSQEPILRIETGMHTQAIRSVGVDRAGRFLVTASEDKTVRVWELPGGKLLRVLRPSIGDNRVGALLSVAISPDGRLVATAGITGSDSLVYVFDRESGAIVHRLIGANLGFRLGSAGITHLVFSRDGARLAAVSETGAVQVWLSAGWTEVGRDTAHGGPCVGADFDPAGRLITSCDSFVRLYDQRIRMIKFVGANINRNYHGVRFSPDGRKIAVGYADIAKVDVLSGDTLDVLYSTGAAETGTGNLGNVAWSADGTALLAGGTYRGRNGFSVRRWDAEGRGAYSDAVVGGNTVMDLAPLPSGGLAYATADPAWGLLDSMHKPAFAQRTESADFSSNRLGFLTDRTGSAVRFAYEAAGASPAAFHLTDRALVLDPSGNPEWQAPRTSAPGMDLTTWSIVDSRSRVPKSLGFMQGLGFARSLAVSPDGEYFLVGTTFNLQLMNRGAKDLSSAAAWSTFAPGDSWAVNVSGDGRYALAAYGDGTIRWYRMTDGQEVLTFFPHADRRRWVLWTPSGYYDASPGGEDLIGWHVNNGHDQAADFFPAGQFRATYYRPDIVAAMLETGDENRALKTANAASSRTAPAAVARQLPPVVEIVSPSDRGEVSATDVMVRFTVRTPSGEPVTSVRALVDGRPAGSAFSSSARELAVTIPEHDCEVAIIAENRYAASVPATLRLTWRGSLSRGVGTTAADRAVIKPKLYVLAIGVSEYADPKFTLAYAAKDARDFVATMQTQKDGLYRDVVVYHGAALTNAAATKDEILDGLDWVRKETTSNDVAMVFMAGHGVNDQNNAYFFYPHNVDPDHLLRTGVAFSDIRNAVAAIAGKALFFVDTCHSGNSVGLAGRRGALDINLVINELSSTQNGVIVFSASTASESSYERADWNNGAFTKALVEGLTGAAAIGTTGRITYNMLNIYVSERVKALTNGQQHPTMISPQTVPDFPIAVKR